MRVANVRVQVFLIQLVVVAVAVAADAMRAKEHRQRSGIVTDLRIQLLRVEVAGTGLDEG